MNRAFPIILFLVLGHSLQAQDSIAWAIQGKTNHLSAIREIAVAKNGDAIFCGAHDSLVTFGDFKFRGPRHRSSSGSTKTSAYVGRMAADKTIKWVRQVASADEGVYVSDMELDDRGNIYLTASVEGQITFMDGSDTNLAQMGPMIAKLSPAGELIWAKAYSGLGTRVHFYHILPREDGKCYLLANHGGGRFGSSQLPGGGEGQYSQYIGLIDEAGKPLWAKSIGGQGGKITANDVTYDSEGNLLICGNFRSMKVANIVDERSTTQQEKTKLNVKISAGSVGSPVTQISDSQGNIQAFIGKYDPNNGEAIEVHIYGNSRMNNVTAITADTRGNIYAALNLYVEDLELGGKTIPEHGGTTMAIAKLDRNWKCTWFKSFDSPGADHIDDLHLDGKKLYAAAMIAGCKLNVDDVRYNESGMWGAGVLRLNTQNGFVENIENWQVGRALCVAMKDGQGYAGGWFHYSMILAGERFDVGQSGQFNAILVRLGSTKVEEEDSLIVAVPDTLDERMAETQHQIEVFRENITISLWDDQEIDGDIISLKFNGEWLMQDYSLTAIPRILKLQVKPNEVNYFEMFAKDVGSIPPATTAIIISDGIRNHKVSLRSSPEVNGRIEIVWRP